ncbi:MAG TPA: NADH-quinone oxidoreductase subunit K [Rhodocyclaceae bacterium]|jgi:multicomponent Na+:H+ antiporter subunit C|nr:NADH-quinone oxidoreductase subunit K [Rhodocyclaceae bacterium]HRQ46375.1 NADH-quinone oxidoreductase subunit K [Rhodocyclaceae bacterium]
MELLAALTAGGLAGIGMWLLLDRNLIRVVLGVAILGNAINLGVLTAGRFAGDEAAFVTATTVPADPANPLPQALVLTAIVIGFGLFAFALAVLKSVRESHGITTTDSVTEVTEEPAPDVDEPGFPSGQDDEDRVHARGRKG